MISRAEIVNALQPHNHRYFHIPEPESYADKILSLGKTLVLREEESRQLLSFVLYYDNGPELFISMVWTHEDHQGKGLAKKLLRELIQDTKKDILLEVHCENPAVFLYTGLKFREERRVGQSIFMRHVKRLAVMQPYFLPYIGYFQLIEAADRIVFYDDVNYIRRGWINRNRILLNGKDHLITVPVEKGSQNRLILETKVHEDPKWRRNLLLTIESAYSKAPYYRQVKEWLDLLIHDRYEHIGEMAIQSVLAVHHYLGREIRWDRSSACSEETRDMEKADRLIAIAQEQGYGKYINPSGGKTLYHKDEFLKKGMELQFLETVQPEYRQFGGSFVPLLSILDSLMFNDVQTVKEQFRAYQIS